MKLKTIILENSKYINVFEIYKGKLKINYNENRQLLFFFYIFFLYYQYQNVFYFLLLLQYIILEDI